MECQESMPAAAKDTNGVPRPNRDEAVLHVVLSQVLLSKAAALARQGRYAAAETVIKEMAREGAGIAPALDLMARIRAQQGRLLQAADLWKRALEMDPGNDAYRAGLRRIERIQTRSLWAGTALPFAAAIVAVAAVWLVTLVCRNQVEGLRAAFLAETVQMVRSGSQTIVGQEPLPEQRDVAAVPVTPKPQASDVATVKTVRPLPQIAVEIPGATVKTQETALVVQFNEGLFRSAANLTPEAEEMLSALGRQLRPNASRVAVLVIGYTDAAPVPEGWIFPDNVALGMARAVAVVDFLRGKEGLPATIFTVQSGGAEGAPYPNDTPENMLRNRTVVIRVCPRADTQGAAP